MDLDGRFFLHFIGAVAYLQSQFFDLFSGLDYFVEVEPGLDVVSCQRKWDVGGLAMEDVVYFALGGSCLVSVEIGHPADFNLLVAYGWYDDPEDHENNQESVRFGSAKW